MMLVSPQVGAALGKVLVEIGKALGKAVIAGVGLELARSATGRVRQTLGPKDKKRAASKAAAAEHDVDEDDAADDDADVDELALVREENARLKSEIERLKRQRQAAGSR